MGTPDGIAKRHVRLISTLGEKSEAGELVGDLVRSTVRQCLISLLAVGLEPAEAKAIFCDLIQEALSVTGFERPKMRRVWESAIAHAEFLIFIEERQERH